MEIINSANLSRLEEYEIPDTEPTQVVFRSGDEWYWCFYG